MFSVKNQHRIYIPIFFFACDCTTPYAQCRSQFAYIASPRCIGVIIRPFALGELRSKRRRNIIESCIASRHEPPPAASIPGGVRAPAEGALSLSLRRSRPRVSCAPGSTQDGVAACAAGASRANSGINGTRPGFGALGARVASPRRSLQLRHSLHWHYTHILTYQKQSIICSLLMLISRHRQTAAPYHIARRTQTQTHRATWSAQNVAALQISCVRLWDCAF